MNTTNDTDKAWEQWGRQDPYFGVITDPRFRRDNLNPAEVDYFFQTGQWDVDRVMGVIHTRLDPAFQPRRVLDFGCGVGRMLLPFARFAERATGIDVAPTMLAEAHVHSERMGLHNLELLQAGDLDLLAGRRFDLVHSAIVLQHLPVERGLALFKCLAEAVAPGGIGTVQVTYSHHRYAANHGMPLLSAAPAANGSATRKTLLQRDNSGAAAAPLPEGNADPAMLMHCYPLTPLFFLLQQAGCASVHTEFTDHGGELGVHLYFQRPAETAES